MGSMIRQFLFAAGELSPRFDGSALSKLLNWRGLRGINGMIRRQGELYLPLIEARRGRKPRSPLCAGGGIPVHPYVDSLLDLRVPDDDEGNALRELRDGELVGLVLEFLGAGMGSVSACLEWTLAHLIDQPEVQDKLRREIIAAEGSGQSLRTMPYLDAVVLESLRMHPPVPFIMRGAHGEGAKAIIGGTAAVVPADGLRVLFNLGDIGRDSKIWTDPDRFRPERFLAGGEAEDIGPSPGPKEIRMMPFGAGHRHCPGMNMGMLNIKCFLAALVREFEWAPSAEDCSNGVDMTEVDGFLKLMKKPLSACVTRTH
jgi:cytochrome P450